VDNHIAQADKGFDPLRIGKKASIKRNQFKPLRLQTQGVVQVGADKSVLAGNADFSGV
jgi:hypothetical protein